MIPVNIPDGGYAMTFLSPAGGGPGVALVNIRPLTIDEQARIAIANVRAAIAAYKAANDDANPGLAGTDSGFKSDLQPYINPFPAAPVGNTNNDVRMIAPGQPSVSGTEGWSYGNLSGAIIYNTTATDSQGNSYDTY